MLDAKQQAVVDSMLQAGRENAKSRRLHDLRYSSVESLKIAIPNRLARVPFVLLSWYVTAKMFILISGSAVLTTASTI